MPLLKYVKKSYVNHDALEVLIHKYIFPKSFQACYGGIGVDPAYAAYQMKTVKSVWQKASGKQLEHFILCFDRNESQMLNIDTLRELAYDVCLYFYGQYQIVFGLHRKDEMYHIHFVVNTISFQSGTRLPNNRHADAALRTHIETIWFEYSGRMKPIRVYYS